MATITANITASATTLPVSAAVDIGYYTIDDEAIQVHGMSRGADGRSFDRDTASVSRAVGGTTAASHSSGATLTRYYPDAATSAGGEIVVPLELEATADTMSQLILIQVDGQTADNMYVENHLGAKLFRLIEGTIFIPAQDTTDALLIESVIDSSFRFAVSGYGNVSVNGGQVAEDTLQVLPSATPNAGQFIVKTEGWDTAYHVSVTRNAYLMIDASAVPADAEVPTGGLCFWFDKTNGASKVMFKGKSADGTVVTGNVPLA